MRWLIASVVCASVALLLAVLLALDYPSTLAHSFLSSFPYYYSLASTTASQAPPTGLLWMAPFASGGGYCSEAISFVTGLHRQLSIPLTIAQHGDAVSQEFLAGLPADRRMLFFSLQDWHDAIDTVICHSEPGAWYPSLYKTSACPPTWMQPKLLIGRTMSETDGIPEEWVRRCNRMDQVWVPTQFHKVVFQSSGVNVDKIRVVPEAVDTSFFNPSASPLPELELDTNVFWFLSVAKWEERKAFDLLIRSFAQEFTANDNVGLLVLTHEFHHQGVPIDEAVHQIALSVGKPAEELPRIKVTQLYISDIDMPRLYASVNVIVIPSRGEGWGRPHIEAMAVGKPVIATNWSGNTEFMHDDNSYLLKIDGLVNPQSGPFQKFRWAQPSADHLRQLMRHVFTHPEEAREKGLNATRHVSSLYNIDAVARIVMHTLQLP